MSTQFSPEEDMHRIPSPVSRLRGPAALGAVLVTVLGAGAYAIHEHNVAEAALHQNAAVMASLQATNAQVQRLKAQLSEVTAPKPASALPVAHRASNPTATRHATRTTAVHRTDDPRWKKLQSQLDDQGKAIDATRQDLSAAKTELGDSIARTHSELVVLQRKGEKRYYEFNLDKSKQFQYVGSMGIRLRKANVKHQYADLELMVDDRSLTKKHVNIYEPALYYTSDSDQPVQVVINSVTKNHIRGYVSEPKYRPSQLTAMSQPNGESEKPRQKLPAPQ
jgi:hypothetical protein